MNIKVSVIIVTFNGMKWLPKTLSSLPKNIHVIIVDNNSSDITLEYVKNTYPAYTLVKNDRNRGFGYANNQGIQIALKKEADYVFLLNQDAYVNEETFTHLVQITKANPSYGIISPIHLNGEGNTLDRNFSHYVSYDKNREFYYDAIKCTLKGIYEVPFVNAAAWFIPSKVFYKVGGFDPMFFHYGEDENFCQRVLYHGYKIGVSPRSFIFHDRDTSPKSQPLLFSTLYFLKKENQVKCIYGNINSSVNPKSYKQTVWKAILKDLFLINFKRVRGRIKEVQLTKKWFREIEKSKQINKTKGNHYLSE